MKKPMIGNYRKPMNYDLSGCHDCGCNFGHNHGKCSNPDCKIKDGEKCRTYSQNGWKVDEDL